MSVFSINKWSPLRNEVFQKVLPFHFNEINAKQKMQNPAAALMTINLSLGWSGTGTVLPMASWLKSEEEGEKGRILHACEYIDYTNPNPQQKLILIPSS